MSSPDNGPKQGFMSRAAKWMAYELGLHTMCHAPKDVHLILLTRYLRMTAYGTVALILALYLRLQGLSDAQIGFFMTLTLLGDVAISLLLTLGADALGRRMTLLVGALGMAGSGVVFAMGSRYEILLLAAVVGVVSPSGNEIGPFRAVEESTLAGIVGEEGRADVFTWYVAFAVLGTSTGLVAGGHAVDALATKPGWSELDAYRAIFWVYTAVGLVKAVCTFFLSTACEHQPLNHSVRDEETEPLLPATEDTQTSGVATTDVAKTKKKTWNPLPSISPASWTILIKLCSIFFLDSLGSGMVPFSLINYYLDQKFHLPKGKLGGIMSATWALSLPTLLLSAPLTRRLGTIPAMILPHLPSSVFLALLPIAPSLGSTIPLLLGRSMLSSMDQAPRSAFLSAIVLPGERTAVMGVVNVVKTLSQSSGPSLTGHLAGEGRFWVAFVVAGALKGVYDVLLLVLFGGRGKVGKGPENDDGEDVVSAGSEGDIVGEGAEAAGEQVDRAA
ncbi:major facilitator superfamily transporter [Stagonosporopsis vannaccii]|nr:major facilitator superfamily transporter [Stagonosporopsis vannaccii]